MSGATPARCSATVVLPLEAEEYLTWLVTEKGRSVNTLSAYRRDLRGYWSWLQERGLRLACLTNKPTAFARALLEQKALAPFFSMCHGGDSFERKKPDPLPLLRTCEALGVAPARVLVIGDSVNDAQAARAAGCPVVLVRYGYNHGQPVTEVDCDAVVDRLDAVAID